MSNPALPRVNSTGQANQTQEPVTEVQTPQPIFVYPQDDQQRALGLQNLGLQFNPFDAEFLDAGADPNLHAYLVGHQAFAALWHDEPSFVFASAGGGKSAFRVRLARACRVGQDGRRILPVIYKMPYMVVGKEQPTLDNHLKYINHALVVELLVLLVSHPERFLGLHVEEKLAIAEQLLANWRGDFAYVLEQVAADGTLSPLIEGYDVTVRPLFVLPALAQIQALCQELSNTMVGVTAAVASLQAVTPSARFQQLITALRHYFGFTAIYILIDGVDAHIDYVKQPKQAIQALQPLLRETPIWADEGVYAKYFLPEELRSVLTVDRFLAFGEILRPAFIHIHWTRQMLLELLEGRLAVASQGRFSSLDAISTPALRGVQEELVDTARPLPREVLVLAGRLFTEHLRRTDQATFLEPADFAQAVAWYKKEVAA